MSPSSALRPKAMQEIFDSVAFWQYGTPSPTTALHVDLLDDAVNAPVVAVLKVEQSVDGIAVVLSWHVVVGHAHTATVVPNPCAALHAVAACGVLGAAKPVL